MIPNMSRTVARMAIPFTYIKIVVYDGGFTDTTDTIESDINGVIQIPSDETLQAQGLDLSINYRQVHITNETGVTPRIGDQIKYNNKNFKIKSFRDFSDYGYYEFIAEELLNGGY